MDDIIKEVILIDNNASEIISTIENKNKDIDEFIDLELKKQQIKIEKYYNKILDDERLKYDDELKKYRDKIDNITNNTIIQIEKKYLNSKEDIVNNIFYNQIISLREE